MSSGCLKTDQKISLNRLSGVYLTRTAWDTQAPDKRYELALEYRFKAVRHSSREATIIKTDAAAKCPSNGHGFDVA